VNRFGIAFGFIPGVRAKFSLSFVIGFILWIAPLLAVSAENCDGLAFPRFESIPEIVVRGRVVKRQRACFASGACVVFIETPKMNRPFYEGELEAILGARGRIVEGPESKNPAINCHSFACQLAGVPGIPENAWVEGQPTSVTEGVSPIKILISEFFDQVARYDERNIDRFELDRSLKDGDLVTFIRSISIFADSHEQMRETILHSAILISEPGPDGATNWLRSKLGQETVVDAPVDILYRHYGARSIVVYRRKP
jgi:hypothetical protein